MATCPVNSAHTGVFERGRHYVAGAKAALVELSCGHLATVPFSSGALTNDIKSTAGAGVLVGTKPGTFACSDWALMDFMQRRTV